MQNHRQKQRRQKRGTGDGEVAGNPQKPPHGALLPPSTVQVPPPTLLHLPLHFLRFYFTKRDQFPHDHSQPPDAGVVMIDPFQKLSYDQIALPIASRCTLYPTYNRKAQKLATKRRHFRSPNSWTRRRIKVKNRDLNRDFSTINKSISGADQLRLDQRCSLSLSRSLSSLVALVSNSTVSAPYTPQAESDNSI